MDRLKTIKATYLCRAPVRRLRRAVSEAALLYSTRVPGTVVVQHGAGAMSSTAKSVLRLDDGRGTGEAHLCTLAIMSIADITGKWLTPTPTPEAACLFKSSMNCFTCCTYACFPEVFGFTGKFVIKEDGLLHGVDNRCACSTSASQTASFPIRKRAPDEQTCKRHLPQLVFSNVVCICLRPSPCPCCMGCGIGPCAQVVKMKKESETKWVATDDSVCEGGCCKGMFNQKGDTLTVSQDKAGNTVLTWTAGTGPMVPMKSLHNKPIMTMVAKGNKYTPGAPDVDEMTR